MLFPVLPQEMVERLHIPLQKTGTIFLYVIVGMLLVGPLEAYLVDAYKRKQVYVYSFIAMLVATMSYRFAGNLMQFQLIGVLQGMLLGMAGTAGITLTIDVTNSAMRSAGNISLTWFSRIGMMGGLVWGIWAFYSYGFVHLLYMSVVTGAIGVLVALGIYVPFRAPIVMRLFSTDRFLLFRGWMPALNVLLIGLIPGLLIPFATSLPVFVSEAEPVAAKAFFFLAVAIGFAIAVLTIRLRFFSERTLGVIVWGMVCLNVALCFLGPGDSCGLSGVLLGWGIGLVLLEFMMMFVRLSEHCQRGTANATHLLACEAGVALGIAIACATDDVGSMLLIARIAAISALTLFVLITYPYYKKHRVR